MSIWDRYTSVYDRLWAQKFSLEPTRRAVVEALESYLEAQQIEKPLEALLDMSCGTGQLLSDLKTAGIASYYLGVEPSKLGDVAKDKGHMVTAESIETFDSLKKYDAITCTHAFPYYQNQALAIKRFSEGLKEQGLLVIAHAETKTLFDRLVLVLVKLTTSKAHYPSPDEMTKMLQAHFQVLNQVQVNKWYIPSITLYVCQKKRGDFSEDFTD